MYNYAEIYIWQPRHSMLQLHIYIYIYVWHIIINYVSIIYKYLQRCQQLTYLIHISNDVIATMDTILSISSEPAIIVTSSGGDNVAGVTVPFAYSQHEFKDIPLHHYNVCIYRNVKKIRGGNIFAIFAGTITPREYSPRNVRLF